MADCGHRNCGACSGATDASRFSCVGDMSDADLSASEPGAIEFALMNEDYAEAAKMLVADARRARAGQVDFSPSWLDSTDADVKKLEVAIKGAGGELYVDEQGWLYVTTAEKAAKERQDDLDRTFEATRKAMMAASDADLAAYLERQGDLSRGGQS